jgi:hypothetical protein
MLRRPDPGAQGDKYTLGHPTSTINRTAQDALGISDDPYYGR